MPTPRHHLYLYVNDKLVKFVFSEECCSKCWTSAGRKKKSESNFFNLIKYLVSVSVSTERQVLVLLLKRSTRCPPPPADQPDPALPVGSLSNRCGWPCTHQALIKRGRGLQLRSLFPFLGLAAAVTVYMWPIKLFLCSFPFLWTVAEGSNLLLLLLQILAGQPAKRRSSLEKKQLHEAQSLFFVFFVFSGCCRLIWQKFHPTDKMNYLLCYGFLSFRCNLFTTRTAQALCIS